MIDLFYHYNKETIDHFQVCHRKKLYNYACLYDIIYQIEGIACIHALLSVLVIVIVQDKLEIMVVL